MTLSNGQVVVALDFDGVVHDYHGWNGGVLGVPLPGAKELVEALLAKGAYVVLHTTRNARDIEPWLVNAGFPSLPVYNEKRRRIDVFVDDRAVAFAPELIQDREAVEAFTSALVSFQPHWRRTPPSTT